MYYQPPNTRKDWKLAKNHWRKYDQRGMPEQDGTGKHEGHGMTKRELRNIRRK